MTFYLQDMKIQSVFFCASTDFSQNCEVNYNFFCLENWLICRSHLKQFIAIQIRKTFLFTFFTTFFFMNQFGCCEDFFKVRDTSKKWPFSLVLMRHISFFIHKMTRQNVNLGTLFTCLFSWFVALGHKLPPTRLLRHFFKSLRFAATIAFHFLFLTFQTIRRSSLDHCALL